MRLLVIGRSGQLAHELMRIDWPPGTTVTALGRPHLDVTDADSVEAAVAAANPTLIVNASAYTAVDRAETEPAAAFAVNHTGARNLALAAARRALPLIHVSTDYVFGGDSERPWREDDAIGPLGVYGRSKLAGEQAIRELLPAHIILRASWLFASHGQNFVRTMLRLGRERENLGIVDDQFGCPTSAADLARVIAAITQALASGCSDFGTYHYAGTPPVSWYDFAQAIFANAGALVPKAPELRPITTADYKAPARRPAYSLLDCRKIARVFGLEPRPWIDGLRAVLTELRLPVER